MANLIILQDNIRDSMAEPYVSIRSRVLAQLECELPLLRERFGVVSIGVFGSVSRGEDTPESDVDVLVAYQPGQYTFANIIYLEDYLGTVFGRRVDVVTDDGVSRYLKPYIEAEVIMVEG